MKEKIKNPPQMDKELIKYKNIASVISIVILLLALFKNDADIFFSSGINLPYGYNTFLKWVVALSAVFLAWTAYHSKKKHFGLFQ